MSAINKAYEDMTPAEKREADRRTKAGGENEARGSRDALKPRFTPSPQRRETQKRMVR